ncbi:hypothetical protein AnigIFM50267_009921 [Aspergillus niger]|nr:hypothetical protein AnigIFM50267_009921 [Aspergillus niger]GLA17113.1 hypothetical protein AnigIFM62618_004233 [Aspergillus niger]
MAARGFFIASQASLNKGLNMENLKMADSHTEGPFPFVFVYTGQGAQWAGMGKELLSHSSVFRKTIKYLDLCLRTLSPKDAPAWTLEGILRGDETRDISAAEIAQPLSYAAGAIDDRQAIFAAYFRGAVVAGVSAEGSMVAVGLESEKAQAIIKEYGLGESVIAACANSPESTTVSGDAIAVDSLLKVFQKRDIWARKLMTGGKAYHSHHMKAVGPKYEALLERYWDRTDGNVSGQVNGHINGYANGHANGYTNGNVNGHANEDVNDQTDTPTPSVAIISTATGSPISPSQVGTPRYWRTNLESPVQFEAAIKITLEKGSYHLTELGPHSALQLPIKQTASALKQSHYTYDSALIRRQDAWFTILQLIGSLFLQGHDELQYHKMFADTPQPHVLVDLPPYPWEYSLPTLWTEPRASIEFRHRKYPRHELLGSQVSGGNTGGVTWRNVLSLHEADRLTHHCLGAWVMFPAAAYIAMAVEAMCQVAGLQLENSPGVELRDLKFVKALDMDIEKKPSVEIFSEMRPMAISSVTKFRYLGEVQCRVDRWQLSGDLAYDAAVRLADSPRISRNIRLDRSKMQQDAVRVWYDRFLQVGLNWGPRFAVLEEIFRDRARTAPIAASTTRLQQGDKFGQYIAHPISIDAMLQTSFIVTTGGWVNKLRATVPVAMDSVYVAPPSAIDMDTSKPWYVDTRSEAVGFGTHRIDAELFNSSDQVLIRMSQARCIAYQGNRQAETTEQRNPLVRAVWKPDLSALTSSGLNKYLDYYFTRVYGSNKNANDVLCLAGVLDLACHQRCNSNILELGSRTQISDSVRGVLGVDSSFRRYNSYYRGTLANGDLVGEGVFPETKYDQNQDQILRDKRFDIILVPSIGLWTPDLAGRVTSGAIVIMKGDAPSGDVTRTKVIRGSGSFPVTVGTISGLISQGKVVKTATVVVTRDEEIACLDIKLQKILQEYLRSPVSIVCLSQVSLVTVPDRSFVISTLEQQQPLLTSMNEHEMTQLKSLIDRVAKIVWLVKGGFIDGENPDFAPVLGLSRALMLEQPSLQFAVLDLDDKSASSIDTLDNIVSVLDTDL